MAKSLSVASVIEKNNIASSSPFLVCATVTVIDPATGQEVIKFRLVRNSEDITYQGELYTAIEFDIELKSEAGTQQSVKMRLVDFTRAVQEQMQAYGGGVGSAVEIMILNYGNIEQPPEVVEYFQITSASTQNYEVSWILGAENALAISFPRRKQGKDRCQWRYKSGECGYTGGLPSCDQTLRGNNGCQAHQNSIHYGAFPGINLGGIRYG